MKVVNTGNIYEIFDDTLKTFDELLPQTYTVCFDKRRGFFLEKRPNMEITEEKVYGVHNEKVNKVTKAFEMSNRSLGVILSGAKGIGKSMFAEMLSIAAINKNIPVLIVDTYIPGIADYLDSITQEVLVLFDEFDKTFAGIKAPDGCAEPQTELLTLFDGLSNGKKLYVITCNDIFKLSDFLINRPGRFHYHFRFEYPSAEEIREYLTDKLPESKYGEIDNIITFSKKVDLNYDCLRAIVFELNLGSTFKEAIKDLNIMNIKSEQYDCILKYKDGKTYSTSSTLDMFSNEKDSLYFYNEDDDCITVSFSPTDSIYDMIRNCNIIYEDMLKISYDDDSEKIEARKEIGVECLLISKKMGKKYHYAV